MTLVRHNDKVSPISKTEYSISTNSDICITSLTPHSDSRYYLSSLLWIRK